ncbi:MAG: hypothetical protein LBI49_06230 [Nocardiopsaceae bacterium]|jgi:hypothetical protein|nr:hypothetical protein [Nocardiopsaceae bacterium]
MAVSAGLAAAFVLIATGILVPAATRPALVLAEVFGLACWVAGQDFGGILTGTATDPGTGPVLILLAAAYWPPRRQAHRRGREPRELPAWRPTQAGTGSGARRHRARG